MTSERRWRRTLAAAVVLLTAVLSTAIGSPTTAAVTSAFFYVSLPHDTTIPAVSNPYHIVPVLSHEQAGEQRRVSDRLGCAVLFATVVAALAVNLAYRP